MGKSMEELMLYERVEKRNYVEGPLTECLRASKLDALACTYGVLGRSKTEVLTILYKGGHKDRINVTGNSLSAILTEAVKQVTTHDATDYIRE